MKLIMSDYQSVLSDASRLPVEDRLRLIDALAASVPDDQPPGLSEAWKSEIERRSNELEIGDVQTENWAAIRGRLLKSYGEVDAD